MQMQAVNSCLQLQKTEYLQRIRQWQASLKYYDEAVKLDILRLSLLRDAGIRTEGPQVILSWIKLLPSRMVTGTCTVCI